MNPATACACLLGVSSVAAFSASQLLELNQKLDNFDYEKLTDIPVNSSIPDAIKLVRENDKKRIETIKNLNAVFFGFAAKQNTKTLSNQEDYSGNFSEE